MMIDRRFARSTTALALVALLGVAGCDTEGGEAETGEVPEAAELEAEPTGEIELEEALPLTAEDVGDRMLITGTVIGSVIPDGFFVATEHGRVLFVASEDVPVPGEVVTVTGTLAAAETLVFEEWEVEALQGEVEAEWEIMRSYYLDGGSVATP